MGRIKWARWVIMGGGAAIVVTALALLLAPRPVEAEAGVVTRGPIAEAVADQGTARVREAYVVSAPVAGRLDRVNLHIGDPISGGRTVVARIRPASVDLLDPRARAQAEAAVSAARAALAATEAQNEQLAVEARKADTDRGRMRALSERGFAAAQAVDDAEARARAARAMLRAGEANLSVRRSELAAARAALLGPGAAGDETVEVTAPASGYVTRVLQESERTVTVGAPLVEVADQSGLEAAVEFLSQDAVRIREGMAAEIFDWGGPGVLPAVVRRVEPQAFTKVSALGVEEQRVLVLLQFTGRPDAWARLGPGYRLWGRVFLRREPNALKVPLGALVRADGGWALYRIEAGRARLTRVQVGAMTDREAEIRGGVAAGARVIVFPSDRVKDGVRLKIKS